MVCAGSAWPWVLAGGAAAAGIWLGLRTLESAGELPLSESYGAAFGKPVGRGLLGLTALWTLLALARTASGAAAAFPEVERTWSASAAVLLLAALAARGGTGVAARCAALAAPALGGLYALLLAAAGARLKPAWCAPWGTAADGFTAGSALLLPCAALFLRADGEKTERKTLCAALLALVPAALAFVTVGCLSPQLVKAERFALYTLTKSLSLFSVMERFEPLLSAALLLSLFCAATLLTRVCAKTAEDFTGKAGGEGEKLLLCAAAFGLSFVTGALPETVWSVGAAVFWGALPVLAQLVAAIKKVRKKAKKVLTNAEHSGNIAERSREGSTPDVRLEQNLKKDEKSS